MDVTLTGWAFFPEGFFVRYESHCFPGQALRDRSRNGNPQRLGTGKLLGVDHNALAGPCRGASPGQP